MLDISEHLTHSLPDFSAEEIACILRLGFHRQERWHALHSLLRPTTLLDFYGGICSSGQQHEEENG